MKWIEIIVTTNQIASEAINELLMSKGANGTEIVDQEAFRQVLENNRYLDYADDGLIDSYGTNVIIKAYFSEDRDALKLSDEIRASLLEMKEYLDTEPGIVKYALRDDVEWKDTWKQYFKPFQFTENIVIKPSWEEYIKKPGDIVIELDPGMAFGTGTHETTRMCAILGEKHIRTGDDVLDLGCGTAILALSAVKLGAKAALAVDIDDSAVKAARQNVENNNESHKIKVIQGELHQLPQKPYDLIYINIIADIILSLSDEIKNYVGKDTRILLSGIIKSRCDEVKKVYESIGFTLVEEMTQGEWVAMVFHA